MCSASIRAWCVSVVVLIAFAGIARADEPSLDVGWNTDWGMLFNLQNIFQNNTILDSYGGGIGVQRNLDPTSTVRVTLSFKRASNPAYVETNTTTFNGTTTTTQTLVAPSGPTSLFGFGLGASYLKRFSTAALAGYAGGGLFVDYTSSQRKYSDTVSVPNQETDENDQDNSFGFGLQLVAGVDWRITKSISLFAEYGLSVAVYESVSASNSTSLLTPSTTSSRDVRSSYSQVFNLGTGLLQGAELGLIAHF